MEYYKAMKMNKLPVHTTTRLKPISIIVRERDTKRYKEYMYVIPFVLD